MATIKKVNLQNKTKDNRHTNKNHMPFSTMAECIRIKNGEKAWSHTPDWLTSSMLEIIARKSNCLPCEVARRKIIMEQGSGISGNIIGHNMSIDIVGPVTPATTYACIYWIVVVELASGYIQIFLVRLKTDMYAITKEAIQHIRKFGHSTKVIRVDAGSVEASCDYKQLSDELGFTISASPPRDQKSNPVERYVQTIKHTLAAILLSQNILGPEYWGPAILSIARTMNQSLNSLSEMFTEGSKSPVELVTRIKPNCEQEKLTSTAL